MEIKDVNNYRPISDLLFLSKVEYFVPGAAWISIGSLQFCVSGNYAG